MNKHLESVLQFTGILLLLIVGIQTGIDYYYNKTVKNKISRLMNGKLDSEVMLFGSSVCLHHFDPNIIKQNTGLEAYNMGFDGFFFIQYNALIKQYLTYEKKCKCLVMTTGIENFSKNDLITRPDLFYASLSNDYIYNALALIEPHKIWRCKYIPGYKLTCLNSQFYQTLMFNHSIEKNNGYRPFDLPYVYDTVLKKRFSAKFDTSQYIAMNNTVKSIAAKGIKVVIVAPPIYIEGYNKVENLEQIASSYKKMAEQQNVYFLDYSADSIGQDVANFYHYSHMNTKGATLFSQKFSKDMAKILNP